MELRSVPAPSYVTRTHAPEVEDLVVAARQQYPTWGGRKIVRLLDRQDVTPLPAPITVTNILHRHNLIDGKGDSGGDVTTQVQVLLLCSVFRLDLIVPPTGAIARRHRNRSSPRSPYR